jgi:hypothetical protein
MAVGGSIVFREIRRMPLSLKLFLGLLILGTLAAPLIPLALEWGVRHMQPRSAGGGRP